MQVVDPSVVEDGESRAEFMALLKYLTHAHRELCVTVLRIRMLSRACGMQPRSATT